MQSPTLEKTKVKLTKSEISHMLSQVQTDSWRYSNFNGMLKVKFKNSF